MIFDWENITKEECLLCILRDKETKRAKRYEWTPHKREETEKRIEEINATREDAYYEICEDEDMRTLLPLPLSRRQSYILTKRMLKSLWTMLTLITVKSTIA